MQDKPLVPLTRQTIQALELPPFDPLNRRAAELRAAGHHVISLGQAVPYFGPPAAALAVARGAIDTPLVHRYATDPGLLSLRRTLAGRLAGHGRTLAPDDIVITAGANHAFALAHTTLVDPGDEVILPGPYFTNHQMMVAALGATPIEAPVADRAAFTVTWDDLAPHVTARTKAIVLCNPSNPTGAPISAAEGTRIVREAAARDLVVISDETYMHFVHDGEHWSAASAEAPAPATVVVIGTFSKSFGMMGWRVGFMLADAAVCEQAIKVQDAMIICAPVISQVLAEAAARECWDYPLSFRDELRQRREILREGLATIPRVSWVPPAAGLFAFARVHDCADSTALSIDLLERAHVVTIPGRVFGASGEGHLRLSYGFASQDELRAACARLRTFMEETR
jgi:aspartate/methionine/tyrosine aminotransferase